MMVGNVYNKFYKVSTLTVAVATLSVNKMKMMGGRYTPRSMVSTQTIEVAALSVHRIKMMVGNVYTKFYNVDTNGCSSKTLCK